MQFYAVSNRAKENFHSIFEEESNIELLPVAIEDWNEHKKNQNNVCRFALLGNMIRRKGQDIFLEALRAMPGEVLQSNFFWMIGKKTTDEYGKKISADVLKRNNVILFGERTQEELKELFQYIDVVVVPSREETFSMVAAEAMMMGIPCIVSDSCGIADFITDGENGFVFASENQEQLAEKMLWCIQHEQNLPLIGEKARKTYEAYFSMERLRENLEQCFCRLKASKETK